jgi:hypothetical protein
MQPAGLLYPVFVEAGLTFFLLFWMGYERVSALRRGEVKVADIALGQRAWPARATQIASAFHNQLELPFLFYVVVTLALVTGKADTILTGLAWGFVLLRLWHAFIHTTHNNVRRRFFVYIAGAVVLLLMWAYFAVTIVAGL